MNKQAYDQGFKLRMIQRGFSEKQAQWFMGVSYSKSRIDPTTGKRIEANFSADPSLMRQRLAAPGGLQAAEDWANSSRLSRFFRRFNVFKANTNDVNDSYMELRNKGFINAQGGQRPAAPGGMLSRSFKPGTPSPTDPTRLPDGRIQFRNGGAPMSRQDLLNAWSRKAPGRI